MTTFNGHKNYNAWNISLWINNDEFLYEMAKTYCKEHRRKKAAQKMLEGLHTIGTTKTSDGVKFTKTNIMLAMRGL